MEWLRAFTLILILYYFRCLNSCFWENHFTSLPSRLMTVLLNFRPIFRFMWKSKKSYLPIRRVKTLAHISESVSHFCALVRWADAGTNSFIWAKLIKILIVSHPSYFRDLPFSPHVQFSLCGLKLDVSASDSVPRNRGTECGCPFSETSNPLRVPVPMNFETQCSYAFSET